MSNIAAFCDICVKQNEAWFYDIYNNALMKMDMKTKKISVVNIPPYDENENLYELYGFIEFYDEKIILAPRCSRKILIYDIKTERFQSVDLFFAEGEENEVYNLFFGIVVYKHYAYFLPGRYKGIVRLDLETLEIKYLPEIYEIVKTYIRNEGKVLFRSKLQVNSSIYLPFCQGNKVVEFDMENEKLLLYEIGSDEFEFSDMIYDGISFWICSTNSGHILQWDKESKTCKEHIIQSDKENLHDTGYRFLIDSMEYIYAVTWGGTIIKLHKQKSCAEIFYKSEENIKDTLKKEVRYKISLICKRIVSLDQVIMYFPLECSILIFNPQTEELEIVSAEVTDSKSLSCLRERMLLNVIHNKKIVVEKDPEFLRDYISAVKKLE